MKCAKFDEVRKVFLISSTFAAAFSPSSKQKLNDFAEVWVSHNQALRTTLMFITTSS
jgi:hypothetical protein